MPERDGFGFINDFPQNIKKPEIVFATAYDQYGIKAIKNNAFDYLLKPVDRKELRDCIIKYIDKHANKSEPELLANHNKVPKKTSRLKINTRRGTDFINPESILYIKAEGNYTDIFTCERQYTCSLNLGKVEEMLPIKGFIRVGRSHIFNCEHIRMLDRKKCEISLVCKGESLVVKIPRMHLKDLDKL
jgi:two-component system, LytTR family, response regulator